MYEERDFYAITAFSIFFLVEKKLFILFSGEDQYLVAIIECAVLLLVY